MNRYKNLAANTAILAVGTFSSKILSFIMVFFYSRALTTAEYGVLDIIINTGALLLPVAMLGINNAVVRFGLDTDYNQKDVFTTGILSIAVGFGTLLVVSPLLALIMDIRQHIVLMFAYILMSALRHVCSYFVRSNNRLKLFAIDGVFSTFMTCLLTLVFLIPLKMGITGYLLAIILADFSSVIFLTVNGNLLGYVKLKGYNKKLGNQMVAFSLPLIPTSLLWWVINVSDRYFVKYMISADVNGLYSAAYKIPTILTLASAVFLDAWQISAVMENKSETRNKFFSEVFATFEGAIFAVAAVLILVCKFATKCLLAESYYTSWQYIPWLMFATVFSCFVVFMGNIYLAEKRSKSTLITTVIGAVLNLVLNYYLIPPLGANGAAVATCASYFAVYAARAIDIKIRNKDIRFSSFKVLINSLIIFAQIYITLNEIHLWQLYSTLCLAAICLINYKTLINSVKTVLRK